MLPMWKLKREAERLKVQAQGAAEGLYGWWLRRRYEANLDSLVRRTTGQGALGDKVVVFMLFQPSGLPDSVYHTLSHLSEQGWGVVAVSNTPLSTNDRDRLAAECGLVLERPNFGYDFGAYREGLRALALSAANPESVLILNDSVWFPARDSDDLLQRMETHDADVVSAQIFGERLQAETGRGQTILGSYMILFKGAALETPAFDAFWRDYRMSSNKEITLRRGERALSSAMIAAGLDCDGIYSQSRFEACVDDLDEAELTLALETLVCLDPTHEAERVAILAAKAEGWEAAGRRLIKAVSTTKNFVGSSPIVAMERLGVSIIKKNNEMLYRRARQTLVASLDDGRLSPINEVVERELRARTSPAD